MKEIVSIGKIEDLIIPDTLEYAGALKVLVPDLMGTGITVDLDSFYTTEPTELHNFVDTVTYRFVRVDNEHVLVYYVSTHQWSVYKEVGMDGKVRFVSNPDSEFLPEPMTGSADSAVRRRKYLGI